jgi:hypothetical protein
MGNWSSSPNNDGRVDYHWSQDEADAVVYQHDGGWTVSYSMGWDETWEHHTLADAKSPDEAVKLADELLWAKFDEHLAKVNLRELGIQRSDQTREAHMPKTPPLNWKHTEQDGAVRYRWNDGRADTAVWQDGDKWRMHFSVDDGARLHVDLGEADLNTALDRAEGVVKATYDTQRHQPWPMSELMDHFALDDPSTSITVTSNDLRTVVGIAGTVEDLAPEERASLDRLQQSLDQYIGNEPGWSR